MAERFWQDRPTFITGATGLIGSWLLQHLVDSGANVVALVRDGAPHSMAVETGLLSLVTTVHGSLEDYPLIRRTLSKYSMGAYLSPRSTTFSRGRQVGPADHTGDKRSRNVECSGGRTELAPFARSSWHRPTTLRRISRSALHRGAPTTRAISTGTTCRNRRRFDLHDVCDDI